VITNGLSASSAPGGRRHHRATRPAATGFQGSAYGYIRAASSTQQLDQQAEPLARGFEHIDNYGFATRRPIVKTGPSSS